MVTPLLEDSSSPSSEVEMKRQRAEVTDENSENLRLKDRKKEYFKLVASVKGYVVGWAWAEYAQHLLIGNHFGFAHADYTVCAVIIVIIGLVTSQ